MTATFIEFQVHAYLQVVFRIMDLKVGESIFKFQELILEQKYLINLQKLKLTLILILQGQMYLMVQ